MRYFPIFIDFDTTRTVVVYGGGEDAARKVRLLLKTGVDLQIVAPCLNDELASLVQDGRLIWTAASFDPCQLDVGPGAIFCVADDTTNKLVSAAAQHLNIPVDVVDRADLSTFIVPAIVDRDPLVIAIGTEGAGPVLAQKLRADIEAMLPQAIGGLLRRAADLRHTVAANIAKGSARRVFWSAYFFGRPRDAFLQGDEAEYSRAVKDAMRARNRPGRIDLIDVCDDPDLLTLKAHRLLQEADIIIHDATITPGVLDYARRDAVRHVLEDSVWSYGAHEYEQQAVTLLDAAFAGHNVVRLYDTNVSALDSELTSLRRLNSNNISIDHTRSVANECTWAPLIDGQSVDGITPWRLAS